MSVDLEPYDLENYRGFNVTGPIYDVMVFYAGYNGEEAGEPMPAAEPKDKDRMPEALLLRDLMSIQALPGRAIKVLSLYGDLNSDRAAGKGLEFVKQYFHPEGSLIIYGVSVGGIDALTLARRIDSETPYYNFASNALYGPSTPLLIYELAELALEHLAPSRWTPPQPHGRVRVDLLVTVDAGAGLIGIVGGQRVPPCVRTNLNYYQNEGRTHGGKNSGDSTYTVFQNWDMSASPDNEHSKMAGITAVKVVPTIRGYLSTPPPNLPKPTLKKGAGGVRERQRDR